MPKVKVHYENADGWSNWTSPRLKGYRLVCCDCGLSHSCEFVIMRVKRYLKNGKWLGQKVSGHKIVMRFRRNKRSTAQIRRHMKRARLIVGKGPVAS